MRVARPFQRRRRTVTAALDVARPHKLAALEFQARSNLAVHAVFWDLPDAREQLRAALEHFRRRGDRQAERWTVGNLMYVDLYTGRWDELERLAHESLDGDAPQVGAEACFYSLVLLHCLRGDGSAAETALEHLTAWADSDDADLRASYKAALIATCMAAGNASAALTHGLDTLTWAVEAVGPIQDFVRDGWPAMLEAALTLGRFADARHIMAALDEQPAGHLPPYLLAQLARSRALLAAAEGRHDSVELELREAISQFDRVGYRYWHAVAESDLATWLVDRGRVDAA